ncbi:hypothetical protein P7K49_035524 [Saguinus oedipus]|uniref:Uncharacterized protein n=1 Tax=Saguinus oedipus TaxID=9490 RepID=A0ABQ9TMV1_SAGOE|nr:hypothetical protein P7K49_035524 [Saguinus oedipus]
MSDLEWGYSHVVFAHEHSAVEYLFVHWHLLQLKTVSPDETGRGKLDKSQLSDPLGKLIEALEEDPEL